MQRILLRILYCGIIRWFLKLIIGVRFDDSSFLLREKQFIIIANHNSHLDTMTLLASLPGKIIHNVKPVAAADYFGRTKLQAAFSQYFINVLLIRRKRDKNNPEADPIEVMLRALRNGYSLILFPEGTRGEPEKLQPFKPGIAMLLTKNPAIPYVPAFLVGMGRIMPKGDNVIVPYSSSLRFGRPNRINTLDVSSVMEQVQKDVLALSQAV